MSLYNRVNYKKSVNSFIIKRRTIFKKRNYIIRTDFGQMRIVKR